MNDFINNSFFDKIIINTQNWVISELPGIIILVIVFILTGKFLNYILNKLKFNLIDRAEKDDTKDTIESEKRINTLSGIIKGIVRIMLVLTFSITLLGKFGIDLGPILASAGIIGLAVGFGAQELVRDFISGFFILLENQVRTGDVAIINGTGGLVEKIQLRTITLRDFAGTVHVIQNGKINSISNMTKEWSAVVLDIGVAYKEDTQKVMDVIKQVGDDLANDPEFADRILEPIEVFGLDQFADSAIVIKARIKTKPIQQWSVGREYRKRLKYAFDAQNIEIPFPHTTIYWGDKINPLKLDINEKVLEKATA
jgi:moderate conductance mechanosensitive channel